MSEIPAVLAESTTLEAVDSLVPHPQNPRQGDVGAIVESIRHNGFFAPCVVQRSTRHVLAGNHRLLAARQLGMVEVPVVFVDVDDDRALRILLADNRTSDLGAYDDGALAALLADLAQQTEAGLDGSAWDNDDLDVLLADLVTEVPPRYDAVDPETRKEIQYDLSEIRQIILVLDPEAFGRAVAVLAAMRKHLALESNTDVLLHLLEEWAALHPVDG